MSNKLKIIIIAALLSGCSQEHGFTGEEPLEAVIFEAALEGAGAPSNSGGDMASDIRTANGGNHWSNGDVVGVYMLTLEGTLPSDIRTEAGIKADNVPYKAIPSDYEDMAPFSPSETGRVLYYPISDFVEFIAYYPYTSEEGQSARQIKDYKYHISVAGQTDATTQNKMDVLYVKENNSSEGFRKLDKITISFGHKMSKVTLNVKAGTGFDNTDIADLAASAVAFHGMPVSATMDLKDGSLEASTDLSQTFFPLKTPSTTMADIDATFTAIIVPQPQDGGATSAGLPNLSNRSVVFTVHGQPYRWNIPNGAQFKAGYQYTYTVTVNKTGITASAPTIKKWNEKEHDPGETVEMEVVKIRAGTFMMGSPTGEPGRQSDETQHQVTLTKDFYMGKYPITYTQFAAFMNAKGIGIYGMGTVDGYGQQPLFSNLPGGGWEYDNGTWKVRAGFENLPATYVSWFGAKAYADWVGGALPTEAQWEYACRAGSTEAFGMGTNAEQITSANLGDYGWYGVPGTNPKEVGQKKPNAWGLYDMHGNVWEWCYDWYGDYGSDAVTNPTGPTSGDYRVRRGVDINVDANLCRVAQRFRADPFNMEQYLGFRVIFY